MEERLKLYSKRDVIELQKKGRQIFGSPEPMFHPRDRNIGDKSNLRGLIAEHAVASVLNLVSLEEENFFVFHSVGLENEAGETDHIIVYENKIFIIETKNSAALEKLVLTKAGKAVGHNGSTRVKMSNNNLSEKVKKYAQQFPEHDVKGLYIVHHSTKAIRSNLKDCEVIRISRLFDRLVDVKSSKVKSVENRDVVRYFAGFCIRNERIN